MNEADDDRESPAEASEADFAAALDRFQGPRGLQFIYLGFGMGVLLFGIVVGILYFTTEPGAAELNEVLPILSLVHAVVAVSNWGIASAIFHSRVSAASLQRPGRYPVQLTPGRFAESPAELCVAQLRAAFVLRAAMIEGPALFGLVICLLAVLEGGIHEAPIYWLNLISAVVLLLFLGLTFPTREYLLDVFRMKIADSELPL